MPYLAFISLHRSCYGFLQDSPNSFYGRGERLTRNYRPCLVCGHRGDVAKIYYWDGGETKEDIRHNVIVLAVFLGTVLGIRGYIEKEMAIEGTFLQLKTKIDDVYGDTT